MSDAYAKLSSKCQTVIPKQVRQRLDLKPGDMLRFRLGDDAVTVEKVRQVEDDPFASFREWNSDEDDRLYRDL
jgi:antitoxin PrlF